ncbi:uncharacterized protein LOC111643847 [Copidosoma floridanum]|uniref:uncharacterized protein LOC111643847 n=1 Tax=Copidosoma floridanum TaxID=29053 RepID=UPI000C6F62CE|nr:uncharacterized protein LOC111643847 [Copidosoma floridanum]
MQLVPTATWHHVSGKSNPADVASRGVCPAQLLEHSLWFQGPLEIHQLSTEYPVFTSNKNYEVPSEASDAVSHHQSAKPETWDLYYRYSTLEKLLTITAYCLRFIYKLYVCIFNKSQLDFFNLSVIINSFSACPTVPELYNAKLLMVHLHQLIHFTAEFHLLNSVTHSVDKVKLKLPSNSSLIPLKPLVKNQLIRVGGRLSNSLLPFETKHPLVLVARDHFTELVINYAHKITLHGGPKLTFSTIHREFWIIRGRQRIRSALVNCITCRRYSGPTLTQQMTDLPSARVQPVPAFLKTGVDYAGPFLVKLSRSRGTGTTKGYVAVFTCMCTRAVHLEIVEDCSSDAFIAAFQRFISRRGHCSNLYSDRGTNFVGADIELRRRWYEFKESKSFQYQISSLKTQWHFNPPAALNFGGVWESVVKLMKNHLRRVVGNQILTFVEYSTLLCKVEVCMNSRPLSPLRDDPSDLDVLTPAHLLNLKPVTLLPELDYTDVKISCLQRWKLITFSAFLASLASGVSNEFAK